MSFNTLLKFLLPPWFGLVISLSGEVSVQFPDSGKQYPPPCREVFLIVNCSYHFKNPMLSFNLCKPQKIFDTFSCIPLVSNVRKLTQASWGEKREWNKRGILQWFQLLNQSPSSKEAALEIFPPVAGIISRRAFFENWMRIRSRQTFYVNSTFDVIICCSKLKQIVHDVSNSWKLLPFKPFLFASKSHPWLWISCLQESPRIKFCETFL